jgi:hypothetical protein
MDEIVASYLKQVASRLQGLPEDSVRDIVSELRSHIADRVEESGSPAIERILSELGKPEELAKEYRLQLVLSTTQRTCRPWRILHGTLAWARLTLTGVFVFAFILAAYSPPWSVSPRRSRSLCSRTRWVCGEGRSTRCWVFWAAELMLRNQL